MTLESMHRADASLDPSRLHPSIALAPFVEALIVGRRVAVLGDSSLGLADALLARGARLVHAYDPDAARVAEAIARKAPAFGSPAAGRPAARGVAYAVLGEDLGVRDGAFDAVLLPDLSVFTDRTDAVRRAKKLVAPAGAVVVASPNSDAKRRLVPAESTGHAPGYYEIFDLLTLQFPVVRMVGQAPFVGYAIVDFAPDREPDVSFDASLMAGTEEPETFVAIASERPIAMDPYLVVEVPAASVLAAAPAIGHEGPSSARDVHRSPNDRVQLAEMQARLVLQEAELDDLRSQKGDLSRKLEATRLDLAGSEARAREAAEETSARTEEAIRVASADRNKELEARAGDEHVRAERLGHKVRDLEEELVHQRDRSQKLTKQIDDEKRARQKAEIELGMAKGLARPEGEPDPAVRVEELTAALRAAKAHADSLASELLAKSKETAELRREHEAAEDKLAEVYREREARNAEIAREREAAQARNAELARERDAATARQIEANRALHEALAKLESMEDEAQTLRRPQPVREPLVVTAEVDAGVMARMTRLEASAAAEKRVSEELRREVDEARRAADAASAQRDAAAARATTLEKELEQERSVRKDLVIAKAALEAEVIRLTRRIDDVMGEREDEAAPEVSQLEAALRDRGHKIAGLERDLRESERIGRELIAEIEALRAHGGEGEGGGGSGGPVNGQGGARSGGHGRTAGAHAAPEAQAAPKAAAGGVDALTADAFQHRIDALAADAAQKQAEILSSSWKIQALERELSEARSAATDPSRAQRELSGALVRAQSEIADLRRALSLRGDAAPGVPRAAVEDAVLLHQQMAR